VDYILSFTPCFLSESAFDFAVLSIESGDNIGRFMLQKLDDKGVEHNHIKQVTMIFSSYLYVNTSVWSLHVNGNFQNHGVTLTFVTINPMNRSCMYAYMQFGV
jgi:hypothetical protein